MFNQIEWLNIGFKAKHFATALHRRNKISNSDSQIQSDTPTIHRPTIVAQTLVVACCANFNFYNYEANLFQAVSWMFSIKCHLYGVSLPAKSWCLVLIPNKQTATHSWSRVEVEKPKTEGKCKTALEMVISIYTCGINTHRKGLIKSLDTINVRI